MNLLDCIVTKILSEPRFSNGRWWVKIEYECYGVMAESSRMFNSKEDAEKLKKGDIFL